MISKISKILLLCLCFASFVLSLIQWCSDTTVYNSPEDLNEEYNLDYGRFNSISKILSHLDSAAFLQDQPLTSSRYYVDCLDTLFRNRFFHGYSHYNIEDDYISYFLGKYVWYDLSASVDPEFILSHNQAACSQQSIAFMAVLRGKGYKVRKVGLNGHFCTEVFYDGSWHLYDTNLEPSFKKDRPIPSVEYLTINKSSLYEAYKGKLNKEGLDYMFADPQLEVVDELPGKNIRMFHKVTQVLSHSLWLFIFIVYLLLEFSFLQRLKVYVRNFRLVFQPRTKEVY